MAVLHKEIHPAAAPVDINVVSVSPQVVSYRMWFKPAGGSYGKPIATGDTRDDVPDRVAVKSMPKDSAVGYCSLIRGRQADEPYRVIVTFSQNGAVLAGGTCLHEGQTDANGYAEVWAEVVSA